MNKLQLATLVLASFAIACGGAFAYLLLNKPAGTQIQALAKGDYLGKRKARHCELSDSENLEILLRRSPHAVVLRYDGSEAKQYVNYLRDGWIRDDTRTRVYGFDKTMFPIADRVYIVERPGHSMVFPFFIVSGCVAQVSVQIPKAFHMAILKQLRGTDA
jgi:hypothetical protein